MEQMPEDYRLVLYNDDKNTFQYIMACLIKFCKHEPTQAEQCALVADLVGQCEIMHGDFYTLISLQEKLLNLDVKVGIYANESSLY